VLHCLRWLRGLCSINQGDLEHSARYFIPDVFLSQHSLLKITRPWRNRWEYRERPLHIPSSTVFRCHLKYIAPREAADLISVTLSSSCEWMILYCQRCLSNFSTLHYYNTQPSILYYVSPIYQIDASLCMHR
jgi:hypothetical protein